MTKQVLQQALRRAYQLGQDYWYQADSDSYSQNRKADETKRKFEALVEETCEALAQQGEQQPVQFLCKGTRFKMSFFQNEDGQGSYTDGTHVTCFEAFEKELDGRWVALVAAEDDCHRKLVAAPAAQQGEQKPVAWRTFDGEGGYDYRSYEDNENYADEWAKRNPNHIGWVEPLYAGAAPASQPWRNEYDEGYAAGRQHSAMIEQEAKAYKDAYFKLLEQVASLKALEPAPPTILQAAPAAQQGADK